MFLALAQVRRQTLHGADQIRDRVERRGARARGSRAGSEAFANDIGFGKLAAPRLGLNFSGQCIGQTNSQSFHDATVIRGCQIGKTADGAKLLFPQGLGVPQFGQNAFQQR